MTDTPLQSIQTFQTDVALIGQFLKGPVDGSVDLGDAGDPIPTLRNIVAQAEGNNSSVIAQLQAAVTALTAAIGVQPLAFDTLADLDADIAHAAGTFALVYNDATDVNNGLYIKEGASGDGDWLKAKDRVDAETARAEAALSSAVTDIATALDQSTLILDSTPPAGPNNGLGSQNGNSRKGWGVANLSVFDAIETAHVRYLEAQTAVKWVLAIYSREDTLNTGGPNPATDNLVLQETFNEADTTDGSADLFQMHIFAHTPFNRQSGILYLYEIVGTDADGNVVETGHGISALTTASSPHIWDSGYFSSVATGIGTVPTVNTSANRLAWASGGEIKLAPRVSTDQQVIAPVVIAVDGTNVTGMVTFDTYNGRRTGVQYPFSVALDATATGNIDGAAIAAAANVNEYLGYTHISDLVVTDAATGDVLSADPVTNGSSNPALYDYVPHLLMGYVILSPNLHPGGLNVLASFAYKMERYDLLSMNPEDGTCTLTKGTERATDSCEMPYLPVAPADEIEIARFKVSGASVIAVPMWKSRAGELTAANQQVDAWTRRNQLVLAEAEAAILRGEPISCGTLGDSETLMGVGFWGRYPDDTKAAVRAYAYDYDLSIGRSIVRGLIEKCCKKVDYATAGALPAYVYANNNGYDATITLAAAGALTVDGGAITRGRTALIQHGADARHNGPYVCVTPGDDDTICILRRASVANTASALAFTGGIYVKGGAANVDMFFGLTLDASGIAIGDTALDYVTFDGAAGRPVRPVSYANLGIGGTTSSTGLTAAGQPNGSNPDRLDPAVNSLFTVAIIAFGANQEGAPFTPGAGAIDTCAELINIAAAFQAAGSKTLIISSSHRSTDYYFYAAMLQYVYLTNRDVKKAADKSGSAYVPLDYAGGAPDFLHNLGIAPEDLGAANRALHPGLTQMVIQARWACRVCGLPPPF